MDWLVDYSLSLCGLIRLSCICIKTWAELHFISIIQVSRICVYQILLLAGGC